MDNPQVQAALQAKYTMRGRDLPAAVTKEQCLDRLDMRDSLLKLDPGVSPGFGAMRNEHLRCLAEVWEPQDLALLEEFGLQYLNGNLPPFFYKVWGSVSTTPLFKNQNQDPGQLRPVGVKSSLIRDFHKQVAAKNRGPLNDFLEPQQLALSKAGGCKLVHQVRMLSEKRRDFIVVKLDMRNAHNEVSRAAVIEALESEPSLRHIAWHAATCLASHTGLECGGRLWGETGEGCTQGDPEASGWFCVAWHQEVRDLDSVLAAHGGLARFGNDDGYLVGPADVVFPALEQFATRVRDKCLLHLQVTKTEVFTWNDLPPVTPPGMKRAGVQVGEQWLSGFLCYGIPVGTSEYVKHQLCDKVQEVRSEVDRVKDVLGEGDGQAIWSILKCSIAQKLDWHLSLCYPSDISEAAGELDRVLWDLLEYATKLHIPRGKRGWG